MSDLVEHLYFNWLCARVVNMKNLTGSVYWKLLTQLHRTEFVWLISGDDNRAEDGKELRREFIFQAEIPDDPEWRQIECSVLEMMIAFARRAEFQDDTPTQEWFWEFLKNLGLSQYADTTRRFNREEIDDILQRFIWRTYDPSGYGGMFPLDNPTQDQREVEIWYQFCEFLVDQDRIQ